jgi:hypothetical protein
VSEYDQKLARQLDEINELKSKLEKRKVKKKEQRDEMERIKKECKTLNEILETNVQDFEKRIEDLRIKYEKEIGELRKREEDFLKSHADILDSDLYVIYKELKQKFEEKINECLTFKSNNQKINDENRSHKINLDTSDDIINQCAKVQIQQQKTIKQLKESFQANEERCERIKEESIRNINDLNEKCTQLLEDKESEINRLKNLVKLKNDENGQLRGLSQMILDQRSETEQFFIECLEEVKLEIFKRKKESENKSSFFSNISRKYQESLKFAKNIDIKDLSPEDKEKVIRLLFAKINENLKPRSYRDVEVE